MIEFRFLSGRGGLFTSFQALLATFDLPLSQVKLVNNAAEIIPASELIEGQCYQLVIAPDNSGSGLPSTNPTLCVCCGDPWNTVQGARRYCERCHEQQLCAACTVDLQEDWILHLSRGWQVFRPGRVTKVCFHCLMHLPEPLYPGSNQAHPKYWRARIVRARRLGFGNPNYCLT